MTSAQALQDVGLVTPAPLATWTGAGVSVADVLASLERLRRQGTRTATRTSVVNLVVVTADPQSAARAESAMRRLGPRHPGRTVVVLSDPDAESRLDADVALFEAIADGHGVWWEEAHLEVGGPASRHLDSVVAPLLVPHLPLAVWYPGPLPPPGDPLAALADAVIVDVRFAEPLGAPGGPSSQAALAALVELGRRHRVVDLSWKRTTPWRELLAALFDPPELRDYLSGIRRARIAAQPGPRRLLAGWLVSRAHLPISSLELVDSLHASIEIDAAGPEGPGRFVVERHGGERLVMAEAEVGGRPVLRLQETLPAHGLTWSLARALSRLDRDRGYEHALAAALTL